MNKNELLSNPIDSSAWIYLISAIAVVLFIYSAFALGSNYGRSPNEQSRIELAVAIAKYGSVSLDPVISTYGTPFDRSERDGKVYSDKAPGLSLLSVPIVWLVDLFVPREEKSILPGYLELRNILTWLLITIPAALFPFLALGTFRIGFDQVMKIRIALLFALLTPLMTYSGVLFGHVPAGILAAFAWKLTLIPDYKKKNTQIPKTSSAALAGLLLAMAVTIEYPTAIVGLVIIPSMLLRKYPMRTILTFLVTSLIAILPCLIYHQIAFDSPFTTGYAFKGDSWHAEVHRAGFFGITAPKIDHLWGILFGIKRGVLFFCPLLVLIPFGFIQLEKIKKYISLPYTALGILYLLFASGFSDWQAGWSAAARHLVPCILIFIFPFAKAIDFISQAKEKNKRLHWILICGSAFSMVGSILSLSLTPYFPEHFTSPLGQLVLPGMADGYFAATLLSGANLAFRGFAIGFLSIFILGAVTWSLLGLMGTLKNKIFIPLSLILFAIIYTGIIWSTAEPLTVDQQKMRNDVLRDLGYGLQAKNLLQSDPRYTELNILFPKDNASL